MAKKIFTDESLATFVDEIKSYTDSAVSTKANSSHTHSISNVTNLQTSLDTKVPTSRTVNGKALSADITLSASDVGASASGHTHSSYVNQNAFSNIKVGTTTVAADTTTDTLEIAAGTGISVAGDATNDKVTITNSGVRSISTGTSNGTISVNTNGASANVAVKGLGSAAYTASTAYDAAGTAQTKADAALASANTYTDEKIGLLMNNSSEAVDSIMELATAMSENEDVVEALNTAVGTKANASDLTSHTGNKSNPHGVTKSQVGLGNVENKSSSTIRSEITKANVTTALGYTPYTPTEVDTLLNGKANTSHGNHVPTTQTANNATFLRNDNTWQKVTPANIGAAASSHNHTVANITDLTATATELNYMDGVTSNIQTQLDTLTSNKVSKTGDTMTGDLTIEANFGSVRFNDADGNKMSVLQANNDSHTTSIYAYPTDKSTYYEKYDFPTPDTGRTSNKSYRILTTKDVTASVAELNFVDGVTSNIQTQLNGKASSDHTHSSYVNQNAFSNIAVSGQTTVAADTTTDTLTLVGSNMSITTNATTDTVTFSVANASTSAKGVVQLVDSATNTATDKAATANAVNTAYTLASKANTTANSAKTTAESKSTVEASSTNGKIKINGTDTTVYTHPTTAGNKHIPSGGSSGQVLKYSSSGSATWGTDKDTTYSLSSGDYDGTIKITPSSGSAYNVEVKGLGSVAYTNTVPIANGGTGATTVDGALTNLGLNNVLVYDEKTTILPSVSKDWGKIAYGNGRLVAITTNISSTNIAAYSDDLGATWNLITLPVSAPWYTVGFGNGRFVILPYNNSNKALYSDDGINWNSTTLPNTQFATSVCSGDGLLVATPYTGTNIMYSNDGITWTSESSGFGSADFREIAFGYDKSGNGVFVAADSSTGTGSNKILYGKPSAWKTSTLPSSTNWSGVAYGNGRFVITSSRADTAYSDDGGASWKSGGSIPYENYDYNFSKIAYGNNTFVALNMGISTSKVAYSKDYGINWTAVELPIYYDLIVWNDISFIDDRFIVITKNGEMLISFDGVNWNNEVPPMLYDIEGNNITNEIKSLVSSPSNNNILINSNFANPVNQRGVTNLTSSTWDYWIDRWKIMPNNNNTEYKIVDNGIQICPLDANGGIIYQYLEFPELYLGKTLTASICVDGTIRTFTATFPAVLEDFFTHSELIDGIEMSLGIDTNIGTCYIGIHANEIGKSKTIQWAKLELGEVATPYVPRLYPEELRLCKRYYQKFYLGVSADSVNAQTACATTTIPCEAMRIDKPTIDASNVVVIHNGSSTTGFTLDNAACVTSQCKFYIRFKHSGHTLTIYNNISIQGLVIMDAEL